MSRPNPFKRVGETAQKTGMRFEKFWANLLGVEPTRGSGSQWTARMDVGDGSILWSLKHSERGVLRFDQYRMAELMKECESAINGQGGVGGSILPGIATHGEDGQAFVTFRADDFIRLMQTGDYKYIEPSKGESKRMRARIPALLRDEEED